MPEVGHLLVFEECQADLKQGMVDLIKKDSEKGFGDLF